MQRTELVHNYIKLTKEKRQTETFLNAIKKNLAAMQEQVIDYFINEGIQNLATKEGTAYLSQDIHASLVADDNGEYDGAHQALTDANLGYLVKAGVNTKSLTAYIRQQQKNEEPIPENIVPFLSIFEQNRIGVKS